MIGGALAVAIAGFLPWSQASIDGLVAISSKPQGGGPVLLIVLAAIAVAFGYPSLMTRRLAIWRNIGVTVTNAILTIFIFSNWSDLSSLQKQYGNVTAGAGLYLYTVAVVAIWICVVRIWLARLTDRGQSPAQVPGAWSPNTSPTPAPSSQGPAPATPSLASPSGEHSESGWYADPRGVARVRYWDGSAWTEHTQA